MFWQKNECKECITLNETLQGYWKTEDDLNNQLAQEKDLTNKLQALRPILETQQVKLMERETKIKELMMTNGELLMKLQEYEELKHKYVSVDNERRRLAHQSETFETLRNLIRTLQERFDSGAENVEKRLQHNHEDTDKSAKLIALLTYRVGKQDKTIESMEKRLQQSQQDILKLRAYINEQECLDKPNVPTMIPEEVDAKKRKYTKRTT